MTRFDDMVEEGQIDPGPCCVCERPVNPGSINMVLYPFKAPVPGTGWGCVVCGAPQDGAVAVMCDACATGEAFKPRFYVKGGAGSRERVPVSECMEPFDHIRPESEH